MSVDLTFVDQILENQRAYLERYPNGEPVDVPALRRVAFQRCDSSEAFCEALDAATRLLVHLAFAPQKRSASS